MFIIPLAPNRQTVLLNWKCLRDPHVLIEAFILYYSGSSRLQSPFIVYNIPRKLNFLCSKHISHLIFCVISKDRFSFSHCCFIIIVRPCNCCLKLIFKYIHYKHLKLGSQVQISVKPIALLKFYKLINSMAYGTRRFNSEFARAFQ